MRRGDGGLLIPIDLDKDGSGVIRPRALLCLFLELAWRIQCDRKSLWNFGIPLVRLHRIKIISNRRIAAILQINNLLLIIYCNYAVDYIVLLRV